MDVEPPHLCHHYRKDIVFSSPVAIQLARFETRRC